MGNEQRLFTPPYDEETVKALLIGSELFPKKHYWREGQQVDVFEPYPHVPLENFASMRNGIFEELKLSLEYYLNG